MYEVQIHEYERLKILFRKITQPFPKTRLNQKPLFRGVPLYIVLRCNTVLVIISIY